MVGPLTLLAYVSSIAWDVFLFTLFPKKDTLGHILCKTRTHVDIYGNFRKPKELGYLFSFSASEMPSLEHNVRFVSDLKLFFQNIVGKRVSAKEKQRYEHKQEVAIFYRME